MLYPLKFIPVYKDYIWGGRSFEKIFNRKLPEGKIAESWEISAHPDGESIVAEGQLKGCSLRKLIETEKYDLLGKYVVDIGFKEFPLLVKFIDANDRLSIQVHPDDEYAKNVENCEYGKTEMWYVISAREGAKIIYDVETDVTKEAFKKSIECETLEALVRFVEVKAGDVIYIPAGVVHAIGDGLVIAEIQQSSNLTYRVYDYGRVDKNGKKRQLHIDKALDVINFSTDKNRKNKIEGITIDEEDYKERFLIANKYFCVSEIELDGKLIEQKSRDKFSLYVLIEGELEINSEVYLSKLQSGESILIPAISGCVFKGKGKLLKAFVPNIEEDIVLKLMERGYSLEYIKEKIAGLCD